MTKIGNKNECKLPFAIVLGLGINGLSIVRSLGSKGIPVIGVYDHKENIGKYSRYCIKSIFIEDISPESISNLLNFFDKLTTKPIVIFPTADYHLRILLDIKMKNSWLTVSPSKNLIALFLDKYDTFKQIQGLGIPTPMTWYFTDIRELISKCNDLTFPLILKPRYAGIIKKGLDFKTLFLKDKNKLISYFKKYNRNLIDKVILQEVISSGDGYVIEAVGYIGKKPRVEHIHTTVKVRQYPPDFGILCYGKSQTITDITKLTYNLIEKIKYKGMISVEYLINRVNGYRYLVDINARTTYFNSFHRDTGMDFNWYAYCDLLGINYNFGTQISNKYWLDFTLDAGNFRRTKTLSFIKWLHSIAKVSSFAVWNIKDPLCFFIRLIKLIYSLFSSVMFKKFKKEPYSETTH